MYILLILGLYFIFCLLYWYLTNTNSHYATNNESNVEIIDKLNIYENLLLNGIVSSFASHKDVKILKETSLFFCLPIIKIISPTFQELNQWLKLKQSYEFALYVFDYKDKSINNSTDGVFYVESNKISTDVFFAINKLKLRPTKEINSSILTPNEYKKIVGFQNCLTYKINLLSKKTNVDYVRIEENLPQNVSFLACRRKGQKIFILDLISGVSFFCETKSKVSVKYNWIDKTLSYIIKTSSIDEKFFLKITPNDEQNKNNSKIIKNNYVNDIKINTNNLKINFLIKKTLNRSNYLYFSKYNFLILNKINFNSVNFEEFLLYAGRGLLSYDDIMHITITNYFGVNINRDYISFQKPLINFDFILTFNWNQKKCLISRNFNESSNCIVNYGGVTYKNYNRVSFKSFENENGQIYLNF